MTTESKGVGFDDSATFKFIVPTVVTTAIVYRIVVDELYGIALVLCLWALYEIVVNLSTLPVFGKFPSVVAFVVGRGENDA